MADKTVQRETLRCPICLDLLKEPVTIPCGHSYCKSCIDTYWKQPRGRHSCPECRKTFRSKPVLVKNIMLAGLVEQMNQTAPPAADNAGPQDVPCDMCSEESKMKAVKSCLQCLVSYCEFHLQPHSDVAVLKKHRLAEPSWNLHENICYEHNQVKKMFCRTDQTLVCVQCMDQHVDHVTVMASAEAVKRRRGLKWRKDHLLQAVKFRENGKDWLVNEDQAIRRSAEDAVDQIAESISNVIRTLTKKRTKMEQLVVLQRDTELSLVHLRRDKLSAEVSKLKRSISDLEALETTADPCYFLQHCPARSAPVVNIPELYFKDAGGEYGDDVANAVSKFTDDLKDTIKQFKPPELKPTIRARFLHCTCDITLDALTAHPRLSLCAEDRGVTLKRPPSAPAEHPDRFNHYRQVLSREALSGRCYWEVEWSGRGGVRIALSYKDVKRQGNADACAFGHNGSSWALDTSDGHFSFWFNKQQLRLPAPPCPRVGVYLDHAAGVVSFYSVSQTMSLLHRLHTSFTQPLHVGVWFRWSYSGDTVYFPSIKNSNPLKLFLNSTDDES